MSKGKDIKVAKAFYLLEKSDKRITIMQGGTRSGKTYNILIWFIARLLKEENKVLSICRASLPTIKGTVLRDCIEILDAMGLYDENNHNKSDNTIMLGSNMIEFISTDQPQKIRGRKRDYLFINEANEVSYEGWMQLVVRTMGKIVIDFNPSMEYSWIYDKVETRDDADFYITTYKDNPFLDPAIVAEIERLEKADEQYWRVYGLGERGSWKDTVYTHWKIATDKDWNEAEENGVEIFGLDFGWNDPCALVRCFIHNGAIYAEEVIYKSQMLDDAELVKHFQAFDISPYDKIYADHKPEMHHSLKRAGYNIIPANKVRGSVFSGIMKVKSMPLYIKSSSVNMLKEIRGYKWKKVDEKSMDEPEDGNDHSLDALRYAVYTHLGKKQRDFSSLHKINRLSRRA